MDYQEINITRHWVLKLVSTIDFLSFFFQYYINYLISQHFFSASKSTKLLPDLTEPVIWYFLLLLLHNFLLHHGRGLGGRCTVGAGSRCAVSVDSKCTIGAGSRCTVGVGSRCTVGVGNRCAVGADRCAAEGLTRGSY